MIIVLSRLRWARKIYIRAAVKLLWRLLIYKYAPRPLWLVITATHGPAFRDSQTIFRRTSEALYIRSAET
jgi:hypothetical protein